MQVMAGDAVEINPSIGSGYRVMSVDEWAARMKTFQSAWSAEDATQRNTTSLKPGVVATRRGRQRACASIVIISASELTVTLIFRRLSKLNAGVGKSLQAQRHKHPGVIPANNSCKLSQTPQRLTALWCGAPGSEDASCSRGPSAEPPSSPRDAAGGMGVDAAAVPAGHALRPGRIGARSVRQRRQAAAAVRRLAGRPGRPPRSTRRMQLSQ
eukprot:366391-Chlamydomonas_euryale.AAC.25